MRCITTIFGMLIALNAALADTSVQCRRVQIKTAEALALAKRAAGRDPNRFVAAVNRQLSQRAVTREEIRKCDANAWFILRKMEDCAKTDDQNCIITQKDLNDAEKTLESLENTDALQTAYKNYAIVKYCNEIRQGYVMVYINEIETPRARSAVKAIEYNAVAKDRNLDTDAFWKRTLSEIGGARISRDSCQFALQQLLKQYNGIRSADSIIPKDF
jgi:hypothetical protein